MRTVLVLFIVASAIAIAVLLGGERLRSAIPSFSRPIEMAEVRTHRVTRSPLVESISAPGLVEPVRKADLSAETSARIQALPFREGDSVSRGDVVVRLDDRDLAAQLASSQARRDADRFRLASERARLAGPTASLAHARRILERQQALRDTGDVSEQAVDDATQRVLDLEASVESTRQSIAVLESSLAAAEAEISRSEEVLARTVLIAPWDGLVISLNAEVGELVVVGTMNNPGTVILTIADLSRMLLRAEVAETDVARVAAGQPCRIHINAYPDEVFTGIVERVDLQRTERTGSTPFFGTEITIDLDGRRILSGLAANVDIQIQAHEGLTVPSQAIVQRPIEDLPDRLRDHPLIDRTRRVVPAIFRIVDGAAVWTPIRTGPSDLTSTLILDGLSEEDEVITGPFRALESLTDGAPIQREGEGTIKAGAAVNDEQEAGISVSF